MLSPAQLEVFYGAADPAAAHVYVRWSAGRPDELRGVTLGGSVRGPVSHLARTLPATMPLTDQGPGQSLLARAIVPDPCYWLPGAPYLYTVHVEARQGGRIVAWAERTLGIRPLGVAGRRWRLAGKGWLPRAIHRELVHEHEADDLAVWRDAGAVMIVRSPDDNLCQRASEQGVLIFAECRGQDLATEARRLMQWPAVGILVLSGEAPVAEDRGLVRNLLLARHVAAEDQLPQADQPHGWLVDADDGELLAATARWAGPILAVRLCERRRSLAEARAACDELQAELAGRVEVAGLAVMSF